MTTPWTMLYRITAPTQLLSVLQVTYITLRDTVFTRNNGTRTELVAGVAGATDSAQAAGAYLSNCQCTAVVNSSFQHNLGIGLAVHGHGASQGYCEMQGSAVDQFNRSTILDGVNGTDIIADFLGQWGAMDMGLAIHDSAFVSNTASSLVRLAQDEIQVEDANTGGAGLDINNVYFSVITGSVFASNRGRQGSGMHLDTIFASLVWNSTFTNNTATSEGGALALVNSHNTGLLVANSTIQTSLGVHGGAIYGASGASVNVSFNSLVTDNQAIANGGALYCDGCQAASMQLQSNFSRNQAGQSGGACYCTGCVVMTVDSAYLGNNRWAMCSDCAIMMSVKHVQACTYTACLCMRA